MDVATLFGLSAAGLIGVGVYGLIVDPRPLRKLIAFNIIGHGVFVLFGAVAWRGRGYGWGGDPVPHALLITGLVVAFCATAFAVSVLLRLNEKSGSTSLKPVLQSADSADSGRPGAKG
jgi:multicomponent Na+:H+ antiporter subunit C